MNNNNRLGSNNNDCNGLEFIDLFCLLGFNIEEKYCNGCYNNRVDCKENKYPLQVPFRPCSRKQYPSDG
jgi:hypothetical protein